MEAKFLPFPDGLAPSEAKFCCSPMDLLHRKLSFANRLRCPQRLRAPPGGGGGAAPPGGAGGASGAAILPPKL